MSVYLDASFLTSLYCGDTNSVAAAETLQTKDGLLYITQIAQLEMVNALELRVFRREIIAMQVDTSLQDYHCDLRAGVFVLRVLPEGSFLRAHQISKQTTAQLGTRTSDLLHVAAALELGSEWLYSFDVRQRKLAQAMKMKVNPLP